MGIGLEDRVVLVTGASRGIGAAIAKALAGQGASVVVNYLQDKKSAEGVLSEIEKAGGTGVVVQADVRDRAAVDGMVDAAIEKFGKIDALVNNANISFPVRPFIDISWEDMEAKLLGELKSLYNCSQAVLKDMVKRQSGKLIFVSSELSRRAGYGFSTHAAAKAAMDSIARVMATELGPKGITVNVVGPGFVETDATAEMPEKRRAQIAAATPLRRIAVPEDIAGTVVFLASPLSDYVTGEYIPVNGGSFML